MWRLGDGRNGPLRDLWITRASARTLLSRSAPNTGSVWLSGVLADESAAGGGAGVAGGDARGPAAEAGAGRRAAGAGSGRLELEGGAGGGGARGARGAGGVG